MKFKQMLLLIALVMIASLATGQEPSFELIARIDTCGTDFAIKDSLLYTIHNSTGNLAIYDLEPIESPELIRMYDSTFYTSPSFSYIMQIDDDFMVISYPGSISMLFFNIENPLDIGYIGEIEISTNFFALDYPRLIAWEKRTASSILDDSLEFYLLELGIDSITISKQYSKYAPGTRSLRIHDNLLYSVGHEIDIFNIDDIRHPYILKSTSTSLSFFDFEIMGNVMIAYGSRYYYNYLFSFDLSLLDTIVCFDSMFVEEGAGGFEMASKGNFVFTTFGTQIATVNISDPTNMVEECRYIEGDYYMIYYEVYRNYLLTMGYQLYIFDLASFHPETAVETSPGWNLLSFPFADTLHVEEAFDCEYESGFFYSYHTPDGFYVDMPPYLEPGYGFWYLNEEDTIIKIGGYPEAETLNIELERGWNLIGTIVDTINISDLSIPSAVIPTFFGFDPRTGHYEAVEQLIPGHGYWLLSRNDVTLRLE